ncbi:MAG: serine/threonine protein kinase [Candidatus Riflebacteria bacterium]|nr:serine/threonine protein kinase [Candidatus Riflebacteria bacterium]
MTSVDLPWILGRIQELTGDPVEPPLSIFHDTTLWMTIDRGDVLDIDGELFLVRCNEREGRFGLEDQPKFWVKRVISLSTGSRKIVKLTFQEEFIVRIGELSIRCFRSPQKEALVLEATQGDRRFMQGRRAMDSAGNIVRIIDFIDGTDLLSYISSLPSGHEVYFRDLFPLMLAHVMESLRGLSALHRHGLWHGDVRNDHLLVERETGSLVWIDFDLNQQFSDFDVFSVGNILHCLVGKGFVTFREASALPGVAERLDDDDASVFFRNRIMNLRGVFPYVPDKLNAVLMRFSCGAPVFYDRVDQVVEDLEECAAEQGWPKEPAPGIPARGQGPR